MTFTSFFASSVSERSFFIRLMSVSGREERIFSFAPSRLALLAQSSSILLYSSAFAAWENDYDEDEEICQFTVDVFTQAGDRYERKTDIIYERMYRDADLRRMLKAAGFRIILQQGMDHGTRHIYIAKK